MLVSPFVNCWICRGWRFNIRVWRCICEVYAADPLKRTWRRVYLIFNPILSWFSNAIKCRCFFGVMCSARSFRRLPWLIILRDQLILIGLYECCLLIFLLVFYQNFIIGDASLLIFLLIFYLSCLQWKIQLIGELRRIQLFLKFVAVNQSCRR